MNLKKRVFAILVALSVSAPNEANGHNNLFPSYENPIRPVADDEIRELPGLNKPISFRQFSGYLEGDEEGEKFVHYWFVESQNNPSDDPLLLWLNGGPGCSSLGGLLAEIGPFKVKADGKTLELRETSWNKVANVLFLETPLGVGFSYQNNGEDCQNDDSTAELHHLALKSFFKKFPQYQSNSLYLSGESYAGVYLPTMGTLIDEDPQFNLRGIAIGNGLFNVDLQSKSLIFFAYHHGLVGKSAWTKLSEACCRGRPPSPENCQLHGVNSTIECYLARDAIVEAALKSRVNPYNIYADCASEDGSEKSTEELRDEALMALALELADIKLPNSPQASDTLDELNIAPERGAAPPCLNSSSMSSYLNLPEVRQAIHIPLKTGSWHLCIRPAYIKQYAHKNDGMAQHLQKLIESKRNLTMLIFNGDVDAVCNFLGNDWFVEQLGRELVKDREPWMVNGQVGGWTTQYDGITYATVRGAGHMVPQDKPEVAFDMIKRFLNSTGKIAEL